MDDLSVFFIVALVIHGALLFFDVVFKSCSHYPYLYFLKQTGLRVHPFRIEWFTSSFNRQIQKWGTKRPKLLTAWFNAGTWVTIAVSPLAVLLVVHSTVTALRYLANEVKGPVYVELLVPGWNIPFTDLGYYLVALLVSSVIHELGHAIAAVREDVHLIGFNASLFFVVPVALTLLDQSDHVPVFRKLRILCAGVWHNIFLALLAAVIATILPWLLYPFYDFGTGVQVKHISQGSPLGAEGGLLVDDKITSLNQCTVRGITSWQDCIVQALHEPSLGFCLPDIFIKEHDESIPDFFPVFLGKFHDSMKGMWAPVSLPPRLKTSLRHCILYAMGLSYLLPNAKHVSESLVECCGPNTPRHLCFEYVGTDDEPLPLPQHSCLLARSVVDISPVHCARPVECPAPLHCFRPSLENSTKLVQIRRSRGPVVLFLGDPAEMFRVVEVTDFIRVYAYFPSSLPDGLTKLCQYVTLLSSGLALLNVIPCFYFDGQFIAISLTELFLSKRIPAATTRQAVALCITILGTLLLLFYLVVTIFTAL